LGIIVIMVKLARSLNWKIFGLYGLGNILGAGIYVLIGEVASVSGNGLILSIMFAGLVAIITALSYAALASKYPVSAGEAIYINRAFNSKHLSLLVGLAIAFSGIISSGALLRGFYNYFQELFSGVTISEWTVIIAVLLILGGFAIKGIKESARLVVAFTLIEALGLVLIIAVAGFEG